MPPLRIAIIGGGCSGLTAAWELTRPEHQGRYAVTVYQMGWRLGGKGASGRGPADRIEEHGLHLWMGFYENAFRLMRECYAELPPRRGRKFKDWADAFAPTRHIGVADETADGWEFWVAHFPGESGLPGDPIPPGAGPYSVASYLRQAIILLRELLRSAGENGAAAAAAGAAGAAGAGGAVGAAGALPSPETLVRFAELAAVGALYEATDFAAQAVETWTPELFRDRVQTLPLRAIDAVAEAARRRLDEITARDAPLRRTWQVIDLILAILRGSTAHGLALDPRGFDAINDYDWREWLRMHGASEASLDSGFMRGIYDLVFAYEEGDVARPRLAAGVALRGAMRMFFSYRGSLFWRMNAGMGDVVFAPLYEALRARGVRFEFFHRLRNVGLGPERKQGAKGKRGAKAASGAAGGAAGDAPWVRALTFDVQARAKDPAGYDPLVDVRGVPSWPAEPVWSRLAGGAALRKKKPAFEWPWDRTRVTTRTLRAQDDFDFVVLAV
ncbi:MAG: NAD(P)-binding protein, partial [Gemmatimonadota bacterium]|nr:NAD(P)-binding protein [Gemmatimonadota bacterium]